MDVLLITVVVVVELVARLRSWAIPSLLAHHLLPPVLVVVVTVVKVILQVKTMVVLVVWGVWQ